jgi:hypothetical protein
LVRLVGREAAVFASLTLRLAGRTSACSIAADPMSDLADALLSVEPSASCRICA